MLSGILAVLQLQKTHYIKTTSLPMSSKLIAKELTSTFVVDYFCKGGYIVSIYNGHVVILYEKTWHSSTLYK